MFERFFKPTAKTVEKLRQRRDVRGLIALIEKTDQEDLASRAVQALGEIGDASATPFLLALANRLRRHNCRWKVSSEQFRTVILPMALCHMGPAAVPDLIRAVSEHGGDTWGAQQAAHEALPSMEGPAVVPLVALTTVPGLDHRDRIVGTLASLMLLARARAIIDKLKVVAPEEAQRILRMDPRTSMDPGVTRNTLKDLSMEVPTGAERLGEENYRAGMEALRKALQDSNSFVTGTAQRALRKLQE